MIKSSSKRQLTLIENRKNAEQPQPQQPPDDHEKGQDQRRSNRFNNVWHHHHPLCSGDGRFPCGWRIWGRLRKRRTKEEWSLIPHQVHHWWKGGQSDGIPAPDFQEKTEGGSSGGQKQLWPHWCRRAPEQMAKVLRGFERFRLRDRSSDRSANRHPAGSARAPPLEIIVAAIQFQKFPSTVLDPYKNTHTKKTSSFIVIISLL